MVCPHGGFTGNGVSSGIAAPVATIHSPGRGRLRDKQAPTRRYNGVLVSQLALVSMRLEESSRASSRLHKNGCNVLLVVCLEVFLELSALVGMD